MAVLALPIFAGANTTIALKPLTALPTEGRCTLPDMSDEPRTLEEMAKEYYSVKRSELTLTDEETETIINNALGRFTKLTAAAIETAAYLLEHADTDSVRWNVTKYVLEHNLFGGSKDADEIEELLKALYAEKPADTEAVA